MARSPESDDPLGLAALESTTGRGRRTGASSAPASSTSSARAKPPPLTPTPQERADLVVLDLENVIRDHRTRTLSGMKVSDWKAAARTAITEALIEAEASQGHDFLRTSRWILVTSATVVSIGFWGAVYSADKAYGPAASILLAVLLFAAAILAMEGSLRRMLRRQSARARQRRWRDIHAFDIKIKRVRRRLEDTLKELEEIGEDTAKLRDRLTASPRRDR